MSLPALLDEFSARRRSEGAWRVTCYTGVFPGRITPGGVGRIAARTLCNPSLRIASGPEGSSAK